ncbi:MAG: bifunctional transaldolase/phosoglucose isomerase [Candidatus Jettenia caeni]|nr:bifunctional transaldolase/phosoglucose isomerase [Candidatus Jettenia caeni]
MNPLLKLIEYGQSYWMDNLSRGMIKNGELKKRVTEQGLRGITSNPDIFNKAISNSNDYDEQIKHLVDEKRPVGEIYEELVVKDVQDACDILRPVFDASDGIDGYVSLEVSPYLAHDTEGTIEEAMRLYTAVKRPNVFIKIPGTPAGVPAIEHMLYEGVNVNITLLFSIESYEAVANAYIRALERRMAEGKPIQYVTSVASFFLSRIDTLTDQLLGHLIKPERSQEQTPKPEKLLGKAAIASAKLAYQSFKRIFSGDRWEKLVEKGARVQRPLWASTSTKNPFYHDLCYVEPLIGPNTVNTMPAVTIKAFADHGIIVKNSVEADNDKTQQTLSDLRKVGIDLDFVTRQLVNEGIQKFIDPYNALMKTLAHMRQKFLTHSIARQAINYGELGSTIPAIYSSMDDQQFTKRLFAKDPLLWKSDPEQIKSIRNRLGWLDSIREFCRKAEGIKKFADEVKNDNFSHVVLLGMGGSSLCPEVCRETFGSATGWPQLIVLDNTDPAAVQDVESQINITSTLFLVSSKSGTTTETTCFYTYFYEQVKQAGKENPGNHFVAITDPGSSLIKEAHTKGFRYTFENPEDIGGRYSALSYFGLVPMALIGIDILSILDNAYQMQLSCGPAIPTESNPGATLGALLGMCHRYSRNKVTFVFSESVDAFGSWVEQLLAESTGKEGQGLVPVISEPLGSPEVYNNDRIFIYLYTIDQENKNIKEKLLALEKSGHPVVRIELRNTMNLGAEFYRWELVTAVAGAVIGINPFDEPNVAESKKNTNDLLSEWKQKGSFSEGKPAVEAEGLAVYCDNSQKWLSHIKQDSLSQFLNTFLSLARSGDYITLLPYFLYTPKQNGILQTLRHKLRNHYKVATTLGYGPRYLHSTGQLHKGGPDTGIFILFTADTDKDIQIPGESWSFAVLQRGQALGDFRSLNNKGRRLIRIHLGKDIEQGLKKIDELL